MAIYLGNSNTKEVHNLDNARDGCNKSEHRVPFGLLAAQSDARRARRRARVPLPIFFVALGSLLLEVACDEASVEPMVEGALASSELPPLASSDEPPTSTSTRTTTPTSTPAPRDFRRPEWLDIDHDCQSTRTEVLVAEANGPVEFEDERGCKVSRGSWRCPYTGELIDDPAQLDVDHMVPLKNAWDSGASTWNDERWREYANELDHAEHLRAVSASANRSKGARGPDQWLPPLAESRCEYVRDWAAIKARWQLSASEAEAEATQQALRLCEAGELPPLPQAVESPPPLPVPDPGLWDPPQECCKVCRKGKACGNTCIARDKTCNVGPGCACDG